MGNRKEVLAIRDHLLEVPHHSYISSSVLFHVYCALGDRDAAFAWLRKAVEEHDTYLIFMHGWMPNDEIRNDPRFREMMRKVGLS